ncbi:MAG TPA: mechanosensitive ion channel family protein [Albidovulum sp.]|uniref:mechanosensitive ion channel family protein n=1 Tax=Albidovulum sp. TaxID=1872424 RepID=UPI002C9AF3FE|nr:mechanosensitive ion channel family protein [Albidovulum sp.]
MLAYSRAFRPVSYLGCLLLSLFLLAISPLATAAQDVAATAPATDKLDQLINLLNDPEVQALLKDKGVTAAPPDVAEQEVTDVLQGVRGHITGLLVAAANLGSDFSVARSNLWDRVGGQRLPVVAAFILIVLGAGFAANKLTLRLLRAREGNETHDAETGKDHHLARLFQPLSFALALLVAFMVLPWPEGVAPLVLPWLLATMAHFVIQVASRFVEAHAGDIGRADKVAHWCAAVRRFSLVFFVGWAFLHMLGALGFTRNPTLLVAYVFSAGLILVCIGAVWTRPVDAGASASARKFVNVALTVFLLFLGGLWVADLTILLWIGIYAILMPFVLPQVTKIARAVFAGRLTGPDDPNANLKMVVIDRLARLVVIAIAIAWFVQIVHAAAARNLGAERSIQIFYGLGQGIAVLIAADFLWQIIKALLLRYELRAASATGTPAEAAQQGRLRTLLPMVRNFAAAVFATVTVLMFLSSLGVSIAPLIAGAGVFGVALGFGSQTLVKDVVSGVFYMLDDAFRVGEYIQTGSYKGTVESFSVRSIRLRHHRGSIYTVPFGTLGAVQNMSRDWAKDKFMITVPFDTDLEKVRKIAKQVGLTLKEDPEFGPEIIEPIKMKGVEQIGDYGLILGFGMMVKPSGMQTMIRRRAYAMLKQEFKNRGIEFASPTVQVAGDESQSVAAGHAAKMLADQKALAAAGGAGA